MKRGRAKMLGASNITASQLQVSEPSLGRQSKDGMKSFAGAKVSKVVQEG